MSLINSGGTDTSNTHEHDEHEHAPDLTERTPLLNDLRAHEAEHQFLTVPVVRAESKALIGLAWPVSLGYIINMCLNLAQIFSVGHIGTTELAASALASMLCNVTGYSVGMGMASALDTLCSQSHTGSKDPHALGKHMQRGIVIMGVFSIPIATLWLFAGELLLLLGQHEDIAKLSGQFARYAIIGLFPYLVNECMKRFLQAQGIMKAGMVVSFIAALINIFLQWLLVWSPIAIGVIGAPIATAITFWTLPIFTWMYIKFVAGGSCWGGWEWREALDMQQIWEFVKLGFPCVLMTCSEWWAFEVIALAAGWLGDKELAAQTIALTTCSLAYVVPLGLSIAASTRIGNSLGANAVRTARAAALAGVILAACIAVISCSTLFAVRNQWGWLWSADPEVVRLVASILPLAAMFQLSDAVGAVAGGVLRGCGRPDFGAYINLVGYYVIGLPLGFMAAFKFGMDLAGLWVGLTVGLISCSAVTIFVIYRMDWAAEAERARVRIAKEHAQFADLPGSLEPTDQLEAESEV
ncbi:hypothetical protein HDU87_001548 [Geranomyces variabilis]|uniref:Uncharacterized protein n=1 Tax=Geranomyces variabilis TaxID=109894 RepID=A0AAD5TN47_9FUNG|nr:hypothetical protein HDU87_001548 [Geranomyces variabilis]